MVYYHACKCHGWILKLYVNKSHEHSIKQIKILSHALKKRSRLCEDIEL